MKDYPIHPTTNLHKPDLTQVWSSGFGPKEYGLYLANKPRKKQKGWQKANHKK